MLTDRKITTYQDNVKVLSDTPSSDGVTAEQLKNIFDGRTDKEIKDSINGIVDDLTSITDGSSGADNIGATALKESGATTVQGQLEELNNEKVSVIGLASSTDGSSGADSVGSTPLKEGGSTTVQGQLEELSNGKVDKVTGKELSANDFTNAYRTKLDGIAENANNYVLPIASTTVVGGVKAGVSIEILPDGTINGLSAPAPDYPAREAIAQEIANRQAEYQTLSDRIDYEESERIQVDTDLQNQITANKNAVNVNISETARTLYGLSAGDANVDKALQTVYPKQQTIKTFTSGQNWPVPAGVKSVDIFLVGGGYNGAAGGHSYGTGRTDGGGGGDGGRVIYASGIVVSPGSSIPITIGSANGGDSSFGNYSTAGSTMQFKSIAGNVTALQGNPGTVGFICPFNGVLYGCPGGAGGSVERPSGGGSIEENGKNISLTGKTGGAATSGCGGGGASISANGGNGSYITGDPSVFYGGNGANASANTGSGGGGGGAVRTSISYTTRNPGSGGSGGSGIVIIRYYA